MNDVRISRVDYRGTRKVSVMGGEVGSIYSPGRGAAHTRYAGWDVHDAPRGLGGNNRLYRAATLAEAVSWARQHDGWRVESWTYMSGDHGYMPDNVGCCVGRTSAIEGLVDLFELGDGRRARELRRYGYVELRKHDAGAEYAEVSRCECPECRPTIGELAEGWECPKCN